MPASPFEVAIWSRGKVSPDIHVKVGQCIYSLPWKFIGKTIDARSTHDSVEFFLQGELIKTHVSKPKGKQTDYADYRRRRSRVPDDRSRFIADVTIPDGTRVRVGEHFLKVWQIENAGSVTWTGRYLQRLYLPAAPHNCQTPSRVAIPYSAPNALVDISVPVIAADIPGTCWVGWKMVDDRGQPYFASSRPVYFLVTVTP